MPRGNPSPKLAITIDPKVHERVLAAAVVYDASVLMAADRNVRRPWAEHKARLEFGIVPLVPAPVIAQVSRSSQQVQLQRFLTECAIVCLGEREAHEAGRLADVAVAVA